MILKGQPQLDEYDEQRKNDVQEFIDYAKAIYARDYVEAMLELEREVR